MESKSLFEKLLFPGEDISVMDSVSRNIHLLLNSDRILDGDTPQPECTLIPSIIDQMADSPVDLHEYKVKVEELILRHEPRISALEVEELSYKGAGSGACTIRLTVDSMESTHRYVF